MPTGYTRTFKEVEEVISDLGYVLLENYMDRNHRKVIIQDDIGYKYLSPLEDLIKGHVPSFVSKGNPYSIPNIALWLIIEEKSFELCDNNEYIRNSRKLFFRCLNIDCNEVFDASWDHIYSQGYKCPFCTGRKISDKNRLSVMFPNLNMEWDYDKNSDTPENVSFGSHKNRWWICPKGHSYQSIIYNRTNGSGCKQCANEQKESKIATELKKWCKESFTYAYPEHKMFKNPDTNYWLWCDIYIGKPESIDGIYIEIHGEQHYKNRGKFHSKEDSYTDMKYRDSLKKKFARKNGTYIEIDLRKIKTTEQAIEYIESIIT